MANPITAIAGAAQGLSNTVSGIQSALGQLATGTYWEQLRPASFKGVPFLVNASTAGISRKYSEHEYPLRDGSWVEDLGARAPRLHVRAFFLGDDCIAQRNRFIVAVNKGGTGDLVHPTLGRLSPVSCVQATFTEDKTRGRVLEADLVFIDGIERIYPSAKANTQGVVAQMASAGFVATASDFVSKAISALSAGVSIVEGAVSVASSWANSALAAYRSITSLVNLVRSIPGTFGRQFGALTSGFASFSNPATASASAAAVTITALKGQVAVASTSQAASAQAVVASAQGLSASTAAQYPAAVQAFVVLAAQSASTPRQALQALVEMATPVAAPVNLPGALGAATTALQAAQSDLHRRCAAIALAQASSAYQPSSADDAASVRDLVTSILGAEITTAGDEGDDASYLALIALRAAVVQDLNTRGAALPTVVPVISRAPVPSLVLAQRLYRDATRADELVVEANPVHPAFMPVSFQGLSS